jgi:excinuclease ABC subunit C
VTRDQYLEQVKAACDFLEGQCAEMQNQLEGEMRKAAAAREYEKAAELRDLIRDLKRTTRPTRSFERLPSNLPVAIDPLRDLAELGEVLGLPAPPERIEGFDISNISGTFKVASLVSFRGGRPDRANYRRFKIKGVEGQDDFASMAEVIRRRYSRLLREGARRDLPPDREEGGTAAPADLQRLVDDVGAAVRERGSAPASKDHSEDASALDARRGRAPGRRVNLPNLILIDGGKGQLSAACEELDKLGLSAIPVIGLAKEFEEIHRPGQKEPLRLPHETGALKLLQRVRDESHRLANTYNAELRLRKISESILDEFPNIGEKRKAALLRRFGSVQRIRVASVDQIAEVPGFGGKTAEALKVFLLARA